jgi:16S rRNA (uracil1498-N3)-methyltransferase
MHRFFVEHIDGETAFLADPAQLHHLKDVLRLKPGGKITVADREGNEYSGLITAITKKKAEIKVEQKKKAAAGGVKLTIACAIPKGSRFDEAIDHLTQLGVERIFPMITERTEVKPDKAGAETRLERWQKIARSAAQQSQQSKITVIEPLAPLNDIILYSQEYDLKLIPHLTGERKLIKDIFAWGQYKNIIVLIGPEGDFTPEEIKLALDSGFTAVSLGSTVLRVATAAVAAASYIKFTVNSKQ